MNTPLWISYAALTLSVISILGSLASLRLSYKSYDRDRYRLSFEGYLVSTTEVNDFVYEICVQATNLGRRPVSVTDIYFCADPSKSEFPIHTPIHGFSADSVNPVELKENEVKVFKSKSMTRKQMLELAETIEVHVADSAKNHYCVTIDNEAHSD